MTIYIIKNEENEEINRIVATPAFVEEHHSGRYETVSAPAEEEPTDEELGKRARQWRDEELNATDKSANTLDRPNRTNILAYRALLRDWPSTEDFPATQPTMPTE